MKTKLLLTLVSVFFSCSIMAQYTIPPKAALSFNGSTYAVCGQINTTAFSVDVWVKPVLLNSNQAIVSTLNELTLTGFELYLGADNRFGLIIRNGTEWLHINSYDPVEANKWVHLVATFNGVNADFYVNGNWEAGKNANLYLAGSSYLHLGVRSSGFYLFNGVIDECRIWDKALSQEEIIRQSNSFLNGSEPGLKAYYQFDEESGTSLIDKTNTYNATLLGTPVWVESYAMVVPYAYSAENVLKTKFTAIWLAPNIGQVEKYYLDVSSDFDFSTFHPGYQNLDCGTSLSKEVIGLNANTRYYYRVRAEKASVSGQGTYSNIAAINTLSASIDPVITWGNPADISYGIPLSATQLNAIARYNGQTVNGTYTYTPDFNSILNSGNNQELQLLFTPTDNVNFNTVQATVKINVLKLSPVITWADPADIYYGTPLSAAQLNATASYNGQAVAGTFSYTPDFSTVLNLGNNQKLKLEFTPTDAVNYELVKDTVQINVLKANPEITWANPADIVYGTALSATQLNATASSNGNPVAGVFTYSPDFDFVLNAGNNQDLMVEFVPTDNIHFNTMQRTVKINVLKIDPVITWAIPADIVYGTLLDDTQLNASANIPGTFNYYPYFGTELNPGTEQSLNVTFTPDDINYNTITQENKITVLSNPLLPNYCDARSISRFEYISEVKLGAINQNSGYNNYENFTSQITDLKIGIIDTLEIVITSIWGTDQLLVWIDWNQDGDFDDENEDIYASAIPFLNPLSVIFETPENALPGRTRMRIRLHDNSINPNNRPCGDSGWGEVEDYSINVVKNTPVITWTNPSDIVYGTALSATQLNATASYDGKPLEGTYIYSPDFDSVMNAGSNQDLMVEFIPTDAVHYYSVKDTVQINVSKVTPVLTWSNPADITYGTLLSETQLNATSNIDGEFVYTPANGTKLNAGNNQELKVDFNPTDAANYNSTSKTVNINVDKANPVFTWSNPADITYGTLLSETQLDATSNIDGEFVYIPASGTKLNAGNNQELKVDFNPTDAANYNSTSKTVNINVDKANPVLTWSNPADITYGTLLSETQLNATADIDGEIVYTPASGTKLNAGDNQELKADFTPTDAVNYTITSKTVNINVGKATPVLTWSNPADISYGTLLSETQLNATADIEGAFTYNPALGTKLEVGNAQELKLDFVPKDTVNYNSAFKTVFINILQSTGIDDISKFELSVFPNPAANLIYINGIDEVKSSATIKIEIVDVSGKTHLIKEVNKGDLNPINIQSLPGGLYLMRIKTDKEFGTIKFIKK